MYIRDTNGMWKIAADAEIGPYKGENAANVVGLDERIDALSRNRHEHPYHYLLNPFMGGPLTELGSRGLRRIAASRATSPTLAATSYVPVLGQLAAAATGGKHRQEAARDIYQSSSIPEYIKKEISSDSDSPITSKVGPYKADKSSIVSNLDPVLAAADRNLAEYPKSYMMNPFVSGPLSKGMYFSRQRDSALKATSPLGAVLSTILGRGHSNLIDDAFAAEGTGRRQNVARQQHHKAKEDFKKKEEEKKSSNDKTAADIDIGIGSPLERWMATTIDKMKHTVPPQSLMTGLSVIRRMKQSEKESSVNILKRFGVEL